MNTEPTQEVQNNPTLSSDDTAEVIEDISSLVFEAALAKMLMSLEEEQVAEIERFLDEKHDSDNFAEELVTKYPALKQYMEEAIEALEEKAKALNS